MIGLYLLVTFGPLGIFVAGLSIGALAGYFLRAGKEAL